MAKTLQGDVTRLDEQIKVSRDAHSDARTQVAKRQKTLNSHFNRVLAASIGA